MNKMKHILLVALLSSGQMAMAINYEDSFVQRNTSIGFTKVVRGSGTVLLNLQYVGTSSEAVVEITNHYIRSFVPAGTVDTAFNVGTSSFSFDASTTNSIGEVCTAIDALATYKCSLRAARPQDDPKIIRDQTQVTVVNDLKAAGGFDVQADTGGAQSIIGLPVSGQLVSTFFQRVFVKTWDSTRRVIVKRCEWLYDGGEPNVISLNVYGKLAQDDGIDDGLVKKTRNSDTLNFAFPIATAATTWANLPVTSSPYFINFAANGQGGIEWAIGETALLETVSISSPNQTQNGFLKCDGEIR